MTDLNIELRILERRRETEDCSSLVFARPAEVCYASGDWMDIRFPTPEFPVGRTYSFASSPTEPLLRITFKRGISPFKRRLEQVQPGETMLITQYGSNGFRLDPETPAVFIAGGVGITPFRSMLKGLVDTGKTLPVQLIYQNGTSDFPFQDELDRWSHAHPWFTVGYRATETEGRLDRAALGALVGPTEPLRKVYVAGPPAMVDAVVEILVACGVADEAIQTDAFTGY